MDNITSVTDTEGNIISYGYILTGKLIKVTEPLESNTTPNTQDTSRQTSSTGKETRPCHVTTYERTPLGQIETITDPLNSMASRLLPALSYTG